MYHLHPLQSLQSMIHQHPNITRDALCIALLLSLTDCDAHKQKNEWQDINYTIQPPASADEPCHGSDISCN